MANTLPNGVVEASNVDPADLGGFAYASSIRVTYKVDNETALNALSDMETGDMAYNRENGSYYYYTGTEWRPFFTTRAIPFTPIWSGFSPGNGTLVYANYTIFGGKISMALSFITGSTSSFSGGPAEVTIPAGIPLPNASGTVKNEAVGRAWIAPIGSAFTFQGATLYVSGRLRLEALEVQTSNNRQWVSHGQVNANNPASMAEGSRFTINAEWTY